MKLTHSQDKITIMKQNSLILSKWKEELDSIDIRIVNVLIHALQNELIIENEQLNLFNYEKIIKRKVKIRASTFKKNGNFGVNANKSIFESLQKIRNTSTLLRNFTDIDGIKYKALTVSLIDQVAILGDKETISDNREEIFEITFNEWFLRTSNAAFNHKTGNYTSITIEDVSSLKGKHAQKLYELLEQRKYRGTSFSMKLDELCEYFEIEGTLGVVGQRVFKNNIQKFKYLIPFTYEVCKKDKLISIIYL